MELQSICEQVNNIAKQAGLFMREERKSFSLDKIERKGLHDYVSYVDKAAEKMIVERLQKLLPDAGFLTEEDTVKQEQKKYTWIIDPLDGTTNYIHGMNPYSVSIALTENKILILGVVYEVGTDECFYAWQNSAAYLNGEVIKASIVDKLQESLLITGFPYKIGEKVNAYLDMMKYLTFHSHGVRRLGSAAIDLAYVAAGRAEVFFQTDLQPWDVAAGTFIAQQAGALVSDFKGGRDHIYGESIVASNALVNEEIIKLLRDYFPNQK